MRFLAILVVAICSSAAMSVSGQAQQVYVGAADFQPQLVERSAEWRYVRKNAAGFYTNFIILNRPGAADQLARIAPLFDARNGRPKLYLESDFRDPGAAHKSAGVTAEDDRHYLAMAREVGFDVHISSLNYGWDRTRAANLRETDLPSSPSECGPISIKRRITLVQLGPWALGGDISSDAPGGRIPNRQFREWIAEADGVSTDGPLGFWKSDHGGMRRGSISSVRWAHEHGKCAVVMLSPYGAREPSYDPTSDFLEVGQQAIHDHEDADAIPDIWAVFEYATRIDAVPEAIGGRPANTTTGMAYWLLHHIHDPDHALSVTLMQGWTRSLATNAWHAEIRLANGSDWLDLSPNIRISDGHAVQVDIDGKDVSAAIGSGRGVPLVGQLRLMPGQSKLMRVSFMGVKPPELLLQAAPNPSAKGEIAAELHLRS